MPDIEIATLDRIEIHFEPWSWPFSSERRPDIDPYFADLQQKRTGVWNGRAILLHRYAIEGDALRGACFETDYASLCAWREWEFPDRSVQNVFAGAALQASDGAWLVGEMAADTAASGQLYFPCGTPEPSDIDAAGVLDLTGNLVRELKEETGLEAAALDASPGWIMVRDRSFIALMKTLKARQNADELRAEIRRYIAAQDHSELVDAHIVRNLSELDPCMPRFMHIFFEHVFGH
ncbi:MAG TPA: NUDIX hydrolase [Xanthobacteraceae bacterium]|nr:NUDIX hydrolase [Xanthobacteraceae bacterium]